MKSSIIFNIPNNICYLRLILLILFIIYRSIPLYLTSVALDILDGHFARLYNQCTFLGSVLDLSLDRASNLVLVAFSLNSSFLVFLVLLDFLSHFLTFNVNAKRNTHHKCVSGVMSVYYDKRVLLVLCVGSEMFFIANYFGNKVGMYGFGVFYLVKSGFHLIQLIIAVQEASEIENKL